MFSFAIKHFAYILVLQGQVLLDTEERSVKFRATYNKPTLTSAQVFVTLYAFTGDFHTTPDWLEDADGMFSHFLIYRKSIGAYYISI
jgi:hypothetical protein